MRNPINSKEILKEYIYSDSSCIKWSDLSLKDKMKRILCHDIQYNILLYLKFMRIEEYYEYSKKGFLTNIKLLIIKRKKNNLGNKLQLDMYSESFGKNLSVYHGGIIVHPSSKLGFNCKLHGHNCIGNNGKAQAVPQIGNNVDIGIGACVIGDIVIGDNTIIGANAVVNKSFEGQNTLIGIPAKIKV